MRPSASLATTMMPSTVIASPSKAPCTSAWKRCSLSRNACCSRSRSVMSRVVSTACTIPARAAHGCDATREQASALRTGPGERPGLAGGKGLCQRALEPCPRIGRNPALDLGADDLVDAVSTDRPIHREDRPVVGDLRDVLHRGREEPLGLTSRPQRHGRLVRLVGPHVLARQATKKLSVTDSVNPRGADPRKCAPLYEAQGYIRVPED